jgi:hypothetical protein
MVHSTLSYNTCVRWRAVWSDCSEHMMTAGADDEEEEKEEEADEVEAAEEDAAAAPAGSLGDSSTVVSSSRLRGDRASPSAIDAIFSSNSSAMSI